MKVCECGCGQTTSIAKVTIHARGQQRGEPVRFVQGHHNRVRSDETRAKLAAALRGRELSAEHRRNIAKGIREAGPREFTPEGRTRFRQATGGENHYGWKGESASYNSQHHWIRYHRERMNECAECGRSTVATEWANISGEYRRDLDDYRELCIPCHKAEHKRKRKGVAA